MRRLFSWTAEQLRISLAVPGQLLDGVALSVATPGPFMLSLHSWVTSPAELLARSWLRSLCFAFVLLRNGRRSLHRKSAGHHMIQAFLAGVSAAVVGVIAVVSLDLIPEAVIDWPTVGIAGGLLSSDRFSEARCGFGSCGSNAQRDRLFDHSRAHVKPASGSRIPASTHQSARGSSDMNEA